MKQLIFCIIKTLLALLLVAAMAAAAVAGVFTYKGYKMYSAAVAKKTVLQMAEEIRSDEHFVTYDELPEFYVNAVTAVEDRYFEKHGGVNYASIARALIHDLKTGSLEQGGSTITQQLAKNQFFSQEKTAERKFAEVFAAYDIEAQLSKHEIFELYVNSIYFGSNYYGIYDAAMGYYGKEPADLTDYECAVLAGIPNAPSVYSLGNSPELAAQRADQVLDAMADAGYITE